MGWWPPSCSASELLLIFHWLELFSFYGNSERRHLCPRMVCLHLVSKRYFHVYIFIILSLTTQKHLHKLELSLSPCLADITESQSAFLSSLLPTSFLLLPWSWFQSAGAQEVLTPWLGSVLRNVLFINVCGWLTLGKLSQEPRFYFHYSGFKSNSSFPGAKWLIHSLSYCPHAVYGKSPKISGNREHGNPPLSGFLSCGLQFSSKICTA